MSPSKALQKLIEGNKRFAQNKSLHPNRCGELRNSLISGQKPFAAVLACSDSRVPVEIIFDVGLGDLFVVRTAGHVLSKEALGSLEYAVNELGVKVIIILGHENCGAINAALNFYKSSNSNDLSDNMQALLSHIYPAIEKLENKNDLMKDAVKANVKYQIEDLLKRDPVLAEKIRQKKLLVYGAIYKLDTGLIEVLK